MAKNNAFFAPLHSRRKILFYSSGMECGWELTRWSGMIRWFKKHNPDKVICVSTRVDRYDLYYNAVDFIHTYKIRGDYINVRPNMYRADYQNKKEEDRKIKSIKMEYRDFHFVVPPKCTVGRGYFDRDKMDFNFTPRSNNKKTIDKIISKHKRRIPICISPRHRTDSPKPTRNWPIDYWHNLYERLSQLDKHLVFIIGGSASIIKPSIKGSFVVVDDLVADDVSNIGLTIEAIKSSKLTIGQQSALPILSNYLKTPTIMWGHEKTRHQVVENPMGTRCIFFPEFSVHYTTPPKIIFHTITGEAY